MTREQWAAMSDEEKRIKVAELCGFVDLSKPVDGRALELMMVAAPDYLNDLNAMHECWKLLTSFQQTVCWNWLAKICDAADAGGDLMIACGNATAAQRAEAFVLTMEAA
jgi:hypothetical protein